MPYTTVVAGTTITASWGNANVRDQVVTPFASAAARTSAISSPVKGMVSYLADVDRLEMYTGAAWVRVSSEEAAIATRATGSTQSIPNNTVTAVTFPTETLDNATMFAATSSNITVPRAGAYAAIGGGTFAPSATGDRLALVNVGGTSQGGTQYKSPTGSGIVNAAAMLLCAAADVVTLSVLQTSGGALNIDDCRLGVVRISGV